MYHNIDMEMDRRLGFVSYIPSQLPEAFQRRSFCIASMEIDHQKEIGDQPRKQLGQHAVVVSGDEMMLFRHDG